MDIKKFCETNPFLYHLTDKRNADVIVDQRLLLSTKLIAEKAFSDTSQASDFLRSKREDHVELEVEGVLYKIRDQKPISMVVLERSVTDGWNAADFIEHLNARVFMWPTLNRLLRHYDRYQNESPIILKFNSSEVLELNDKALFTNLNSGATRCHPYYDGNAPYRGPNTFKLAEDYELGARSVGEVTFKDSCQLPKTVWTGEKPNGPWTLL